jgi:uncharacterized protein YjbJ (UPF0337 family)
MIAVTIVVAPGIFRSCSTKAAHCISPARIPSGNIRTFRALQRERQENMVMDKHRIAGAAKQVKGAAKEAIGKAIGDAKLQADGKADKAEGTVQKAIGGMSDAIRDALKK